MFVVDAKNWTKSIHFVVNLRLVLVVEENVTLNSNKIRLPIFYMYVCTYFDCTTPYIVSAVFQKGKGGDNC